MKSILLLWILFYVSSSASEETCTSQALPTRTQEHSILVSSSDGLSVPINTTDASLADRIRDGVSVLTVENLLDPSEIEYIIRASLEASDKKHNNTLTTIDTDGNSNSNGKPCVLDGGFQGKDRMPVHAAAQREGCDDGLSQAFSHYLEETVLARAMKFVDDELPSLSSTLFLTDSIEALYRSNKLEWHVGEPAINIYLAPAGGFRIHKDRKALTVLVPLSADADFVGGGTAFFDAQQPASKEVEETGTPSLVLTPPAGTAILFGGNVAHRGMPITAGSRLVFVASFSRKAKVRYKNGEFLYDYV